MERKRGEFIPVGDPTLPGFTPRQISITPEPVVRTLDALGALVGKLDVRRIEPNRLGGSMSVELISVLIAVLAVGAALGGLILTGNRGLRQDLAQLGNAAGWEDRCVGISTG